MKKENSKNKRIGKYLSLTDSGIEIYKQFFDEVDRIEDEIATRVLETVALEPDKYFPLEKSIYLEKVKELLRDEYDKEANNYNFLVDETEFVHHNLFYMDILYDATLYGWGDLNEKED